MFAVNAEFHRSPIDKIRETRLEQKKKRLSIELLLLHLLVVRNLFILALFRAIQDFVPATGATPPALSTVNKYTFTYKSTTFTS